MEGVRDDEYSSKKTQNEIKGQGKIREQGDDDSRLRHIPYTSTNRENLVKREREILERRI